MAGVLQRPFLEASGAHSPRPRARPRARLSLPLGEIFHSGRGWCLEGGPLNDGRGLGPMATWSVQWRAGQ